MLRKKLNKALLTVSILAFVVIFSCTNNKVEDEKTAGALNSNTKLKWATVNITFQPAASYQLRQDYLNEVNEFLKNYVISASDSSKSLRFTPTLNQTTKDTLHYSIVVGYNRQYKALSDSIADPKCPPLPGPRSFELAQLEILCALLGQQ